MPFFHLLVQVFTWPASAMRFARNIFRENVRGLPARLRMKRQLNEWEDLFAECDGEPTADQLFQAANAEQQFGQDPLMRIVNTAIRTQHRAQRVHKVLTSRFEFKRFIGHPM